MDLTAQPANSKEFAGCNSFYRWALPAFAIQPDHGTCNQITLWICLNIIPYGYNQQQNVCFYTRSGIIIKRFIIFVPYGV